MKINNKLKTAAVLAVLIFAVPNSYAENVSDFNGLKEKVSSSSGDIIQVDDISDFSDTLTVPGDSGQDVHIQSGKTEGNAKFSPSSPSTKRAFDNNGGLNLDKVDIEGFDVQSGGSDKNGGAVKNASSGRLTLDGAGLKNNKAENGGAVYNDTNSQLTVKGGTSFSDNKATTNGGAVYNKGELTITSDNNGDVTFENNTAAAAGGADLYQDSEGKTQIDGSAGNVTFKDGIAGNGTITHIGDGSLLLEGDNSNYKGTFENSKGTVTVGDSAKFFGGNSTVKGGELKWETSNDLEDGASLKFGDTEGQGGSLVLGTGSNNSNLTVKNDSSIAGASSVELKSGSTLDIQKEDTFYGTMNGEGTLNLADKESGAGLTFKGNADVSGVKFVSEGGEVTFDGAENVDSLISGLFGETSQASKVDILFKDDEITKDLEVQGENGEINSVTFQNENSYNGTLTNSDTGKVTVDSDANLTLGGTVENSSEFNVKGNLNGAGSVNNSGTVNLESNADASGFTGNFTQSVGKTDVKGNSKFFGGTSTVTGGALNWETSNDLTGTLKMEGGNLTVGSASVPSEGVKLTIKDGSSIDGVESVTVNSNSTLGIETDTTITGTLSGEGTLDLKGAKLTFDETSGESILADGDSLKFNSSEDSTVLVKDTDSIGDFIDFVIGGNAKNEGLTLQLQNAAGTVDNELNIDGTNLKELDFLEGTNQYNASGKKIKVSNNGVLNNQGTTTITGDIENTHTTSDGIVNSSELTVSGTLNNSGKLQNTGSLTVGTLNADLGSDINNASGTLKVTGAAENDAKITGGILQFNSLTNNGGGEIIDAESITVTKKVTNIGKIEGKEMAFDSLDNQGALTSSSTLTITGNEVLGDKALKNSGTGIISAAVIAVTGDIENSGDRITATTGDITAVNISNTSGTIAATAGAITASGNITNGGESITAGGTISAVGITNSNGTIEAAVINATGNIENSGDSITATTGDITAVNISNTNGTIAATAGAITASGDITNEGESITAGGTISAVGITNSNGTIEAAVINATGNIENSGDSITATTGDITAVDISNTSGAIKATTGAITASGNLENSGTISAGQELSALKITNNAGSITASAISATSGDIENSGDSITATTGDITAVDISNTSGAIKATTGAITASGDITNGGESITAGGTISAANITNESGSITAALIEAVEDINNSGDDITSEGDITASNITNSNGTIESTNGNVEASGDINNTNGSIKAKQKLSAEGSVTNSGEGTLQGSEIELGSVASNEGTIESTTGGITINDGITSNTGSVTANGKLTVSGDVSNTGEGSLQGSEIELGSVASNEGKIESTEGGITVNGDLSNAGTITSASDLTVKGVLTNDKDITVEGTLTATEGKLTNNTEGVIDIKGGSLADVDNEGNITNDGDLSVSGTITGSSGTITHNGGELTLSGDASGYTGTFNLDGGTLNVEESGTLFGGETKINNGAELDITSSGPIDFTGVVLGNNGIFNYTSTGENESTIDNDVLSFEGTNATATFAGENETYTLADGFQGDENNLTFKNTTLKLEGTDYQEAGAITLEDSTLDLHEDEYSTDEYYFKKFTSKNGKVDLDVQIQKAEDEDKTAYLETDRLHFDEESTGSLSIGKLHIANEDNSENGLDITTAEDEDIIDGENVSFGESTVGQTLYKATTSFTYDVEVSDKTLKLKKTGVTDADTLKDMNVREGKREFSYKGTYHSSDDLGSTADGTFLVYGESEDGSDVLSGIKEGTDDEKVSFFDIGEDKTTHLEISDLTIEDTESEKGGSVARNESENSSVIVTGSTIQNNASTGGKGGAFYNNGGRDIDFETEEDIDGVGLAIQESTLKGNKSVDGIGGAIYNDENGSMYLADVIVEAGTDDASNDIYNAGNAFVKSDDSLLVGGNLFQSKFTNKGNIIFEGKNTISDYVNNGGTTKFNGSTYLDDVSGDSGTITNSLEVTLRGDASNYQGEYVQKQAEAGKQSITQVEEGAKFFGGTTTIEDGILNWFTNEESDYTLKVEKGIVNIGDGEDETGTLNLTTGSSIAEGVETNIYKDSELGIMGSDVEVTLGENSTWEGNVNLEEGTLNIDGITNATIDPQGNIKDILGSVTASGGNLNLQNGSVLAVDEKSNVDENVILNIDKDSAAGVFGGGSLTVSDGDTWAGDLYMDKNATGELTIKDYTGSNGLLEANGGRLTITGTSDITLQSQGSGEEIENSFIAKEVQTTIDGDATVHVKNGGELTLDNATNDTWAGTVDLREGGTFNYGMTDITGTLTAEGGNLNLLEGSILTIKEPSVVEEAVAVDIQKGSVVKIEDGADFTIDSETNDKWNGTIQILKDGAATEGGSLITEGIDNTVSGYGGGLQQNTGSSTFDLKSNIHISDASSYITGGDVNIKGESQLSFGAGVQDLSVDNLNMEDNTKLGIMNGEINYAQAEQVNVEGTANFAVDLNPRSHIGDQFEFGSITGSSGDAELNISDFNFQGGAPIDRYIYFELFTGDKNSVDFTATKDLKFTPIGYYGLQSMGEGMYRAYLDHYNPQVFRGQVATIGMYTNQLMTDDIVTNHFVLHNERLIDSAKNANKYSAVSPLFQPYQQTYEDGGLWNKSYASFNRLNLTQGLNVGNNVYGTLLGADLPAIELKNNWKLIPTGYVGYNGGHQYYSGVSSYQNGGQLGVMGTFLKDNFVGSVTAYGGGYMNDMDVAGHNDSTANWFAGAATKAAYNVKLSETFTFQPNIFAAYNGFGRQKWHTDFGDMTMHSGMLNGANVAPGANFIFDKKTWSLYASVQYMFFINDRVNGGAGNVNLPNVRMHHGYLQYGLGGTKVWKDRLAAYGQFNILNAGITGIGVQAGMHYKFDLHLPFTKKEYSNGEKKYIKKL